MPTLPARLALLLALSATVACGRAVPLATSPAAVARDGYSLYDLGSTWTRQDGAAITLDSLRGRPRVLAMVYTHCQAACPLAIAELKRIAAHTDARLGFVLVSLDPARDTPHALESFARASGLDSARWTLLAGTDADVREVAAAIGVRYRRQSPSELAHSSSLLLLDADGREVERQEGVGGESSGLVAAAQALLLPSRESATHK